MWGGGEGGESKERWQTGERGKVGREFNAQLVRGANDEEQDGRVRADGERLGERASNEERMQEGIDDRRVEEGRDERRIKEGSDRRVEEGRG